MSETLNVWKGLSICILINAKFIKLCGFGFALDILESNSVFWQ